MSTLKQLSFSAGEIAPSLYARTDQVKYATGARTVRNFIVMRHGGLTSRPATKFVGEIKDSTKAARLIPFVVSNTVTYMLEFGEATMRVIKNGVYVTDLDLTITNVTNANPAVLTYTGTDPVNGEEVTISGVGGALGNYLNGRNFKIANVNGGANTLELKYMDGTNVNSTSFGAGTYTASSFAKRIFTLVSPFTAGNLSTLQYVQNSDKMYLVQKLYIPQELIRVSDTSWSIRNFSPAAFRAASGSFSIEGQAAPTALTGTAGAAGTYVVTAVASESLVESIVSNTFAAAATPTTLTWTAPAGTIAKYNIYKRLNGIDGYIGSSGGTTLSFTDTGITPDFTDNPPVDRNPLSGTNYPAAVSLFQQRLIMANIPTNIEAVFTSKTNVPSNFNLSAPIQDDDHVTFQIRGRSVNEIRHILDIGKMVLFTTAGEFVAEGGASGIVTPTEVNLKQHSYNGATTLSPIPIDNTALYVQARGSIVRDLLFDFSTDGYKGNDLTIFSSHLVDGYDMVDWTFQQTPHSIVWAVRDDGVLLGLTYVREHQLVGWHRHDFDGTVENVATVSEGTEDVTYLVIKRTISGATKRYVERFVQRRVDAIEDFIGMDAALTYDGTNTTATTMTLSGGTTWVYTETLTLTASAAFFLATDVGNAIHLTGSDGTMIRFTIDAFTSTTVVTGRPHKTVPVAMRSVATAIWTKAVDEVGGLWHLEGKNVSVLGDGFVVASPNNAANTIRTVTNGSVTLDRPYGIIHVGLPITADIETLDVDTVQGETMADKKKIVSKLSVYVEESRGIWAGTEAPADDAVDPLQGLTELKIRNDESYDDPVALQTGVVEVIVQPVWNSNGRVFIRQVDPVPLSVLAIAPAGMFPIGR